EATEALVAAGHDLHDTAAVLAANGRSQDAVQGFAAVDGEVVRVERAAAWAPGLAVAGQAMITAAVVATTLWLCAYAGLPGPTVTVLALLPLALVDPLAAIPPAAQRLIAASRAQATLADLAALPRVRPVTAPGVGVQEGEG